MGNSAVKALPDTKLSPGILHLDAGYDAMAISPKLISKSHGVTKVKGQGSSWTKDSTEGGLLFKCKHKGVIHAHGEIEDSDGNIIATVVSKKRGISTLADLVCRDHPTFDDQKPLTADELTNAGIKQDVTWYPFAKVLSERSATHAKATYSVVVGEEGAELSFRDLYVGKKVKAANLVAKFETADGHATIAKAASEGKSVSSTVHLEVAIGVDTVAIVCLENTLASRGADSVGSHI